MLLSPADILKRISSLLCFLAMMAAWGGTLVLGLVVALVAGRNAGPQAAPRPAASEPGLQWDPQTSYRCGRQEMAEQMGGLGSGSGLATSQLCNHGQVAYPLWVSMSSLVKCWNWILKGVVNGHAHVH